MKSTLTLLAIFFGALLFLNNSGGPASVQGVDRTGSPNSPGGCGVTGCHASGAFEPTVSIQVTRGGVPVIGYEPGESHTITVTVEAGQGEPAGYGFQAVTLNSANEQAGQFGFPSGGQQLIIFADGFEFMEHDGPSTLFNSFNMIWDAPAAGEGDVTIYAAGNAIDGNGAPSNDGAMSTSFTLSEGLLSNTDDVEQFYHFATYPNPVEDLLNIKVNSLSSGDATLKIMDMGGQTIYVEKFEIIQGENIKTIETNDLKNGMYFVTVSSDLETVTETVVKM